MFKDFVNDINKTLALNVLALYVGQQVGYQKEFEESMKVDIFHDILGLIVYHQGIKQITQPIVDHLPTADQDMYHDLVKTTVQVITPSLLTGTILTGILNRKFIFSLVMVVIYHKILKPILIKIPAWNNIEGAEDITEMLLYWVIVAGMNPQKLFGKVIAIVAYHQFIKFR